MDDLELEERVDRIKQFLQNTRSDSFLLPRSFYSTTTGTTATTTTSTTSATATTASNVLPWNIRRAHIPMRFLDGSTGGPVFGRYNAYSPYNRSYTNMYMDGYSAYNLYGQPMTNQFKNPVILAAAENVRPAFELIQSVVNSFNNVSMMINSTITATHMSFQALLDITENVSRLRTFMVKLNSTIVSFKLVRWFLTKLVYLLRMVKGDRGTNVETDFLSSLSSTAQEEVPSVGRSWPLVVFTGIIVAAPFIVHKLLNTVVPMPKSVPPVNYTKRSALGTEFLIVSQNNWSSTGQPTIPLVKGQHYWASNSNMIKSSKNGGWLYVRNEIGQKGFVPLKFLQQSRTDDIDPLFQPPLLEEYPNVINEVEVPIESPAITIPITDANDNPIILPQSPIDDPLVDTSNDPLENNTQ